MEKSTALSQASLGPSSGTPSGASTEGASSALPLQPETFIERQDATGKLGRAQLETALRKSLAAGPAQLARQVRYMLALSQLIDARSRVESLIEKPLSIAHARLAALAELAAQLDQKQINALVKEITQITDETARIELLVALALHVPSGSYQSLVRDVLMQTRALKDPAARSRLTFQIAPLLLLLNDEPSTSSDALSIIAIAQAIGNTEARVRSLVALSPHLPPALSIRLLSRVLDDVDSVNNDTLRSNTIAAMAGHLPDEIEERTLKSALRIQSPNERARAMTALARTMSEAMLPRLRTAALDAIADISTEEDRCAALILFAPHLEYATEAEQFPSLLEKALAIAISLLRRPLRARALVALAPHLTLDLQGEALAAVHSQSSERDRAALLADLAPSLPPEMLVASLAVAHTMREHDARVHALTVLAHYVPEHARNQTILDALAAAANLPHHFERVMALVALLDILPPLLREQALTNALETARLIENENARARALGLLGMHLPPQLLQRAVEAAFGLNDPEQRLSALVALLPSIDAAERPAVIAHILECVQQMPFGFKRTRALVSAAAHFTPEVMPGALAIASDLDDPFDQASAYIALAHNLPPQERPAIINKAWARIKKIEDGYDQASALVAVAPYLPPSASRDIAQIAATVIGAIMDEYDQASAISILSPLLANSDRLVASTMPDYITLVREAFLLALEVPYQGQRITCLQHGVNRWIEMEPDERYQLWQDIAPRLARLPLADTLMCLRTLSEVLRAIGGENGLKEIALILGVR